MNSNTTAPFVAPIHVYNADARFVVGCSCATGGPCERCRPSDRVVVVRAPPKPPESPEPARMNRQQRRRAMIDAGFNRSTRRYVSWLRAETRAGRHHCVTSDITPFLSDLFGDERPSEER